jgi:hypothetical protein
MKMRRAIRAKRSASRGRWRWGAGGDRWSSSGSKLHRRAHRDGPRTPARWMAELQQLVGR